MPRGRRLTERQCAEIRRRREAGERVKDIARALGVCRASITDVTRDLGRREPLSDEEIAEVRRMWRAGKKLAVIADTVRVDRRSIYNHTKGLPRRGVGGMHRSITMTVGNDKQVIIDVPDGDGTRALILVEPTGYFTFGITGHHTEKQWLMEARDGRDGRIKFFALVDIRAWHLPGDPGTTITTRTPQRAAERASV